MPAVLVQEPSRYTFSGIVPVLTDIETLEVLSTPGVTAVAIDPEVVLRQVEEPGPVARDTIHEEQRHIGVMRSGWCGQGR